MVQIAHINLTQTNHARQEIKNNAQKAFLSERQHAKHGENIKVQLRSFEVELLIAFTLERFFRCETEG
jgi:hypothetical protein